MIVGCINEETLIEQQVKIINEQMRNWNLCNKTPDSLSFFSRNC